ncbi:MULTISPECIES: NADPH-dependent FMN reductase [Paenibacillus]|uniref:NADPH-dependent FMN reductase n=1 Tax=Paenibacillus TaxID=44249 RepID=UPI0022B8851B|nr:NADPH-dependent FMN reductase [Paenibacillus caseinilyticus]MCZ8522460.1 NAD(P)H-dependent oxidoreductase [Paenibacillus caseinilyticus]
MINESPKLNLLALSGSLRSRSSNTDLLKAIAALAPGSVHVSFFEAAGELPHFNPDLDQEGDEAPEAVRSFRSRLQSADALLICTPEYARGVPGSLKNALDWIVSSGELVNKPVSVISASPFETGGEIAQASLLLTLGMMTAKLDPSMNLAVPFVNKKLKGDEITDEATKDRLKMLLGVLLRHAAEVRA